MRPILRTVLTAAHRPVVPLHHQQHMRIVRTAWIKNQTRCLSSGVPPGSSGSGNDQPKRTEEPSPASADGSTPKQDPTFAYTPSPSTTESNPSPAEPSPVEPSFATAGTSTSSSADKSSTTSSNTTKASPSETPSRQYPKLSAHAEKLLADLPSELERRRSALSKKFSHSMDNLQTALFSASRKLNDLTGYSSIETLKRSIEDLEAHVAQTRHNVTEAKAAYQAAIARRSASQREVNELLQRKHAWNATDLERFTGLYRSDHANEQEEHAAHQRLQEAEREADEAQAKLATSILARYHEEQIWSDKIRRASTWGTWGLMGFNVLLFIIVQLGLEPWKRKRLVGGFEEKVREVIAEENSRVALLMKVEREEEEKVVRARAEEVNEAIEEVVEEEIKQQEAEEAVVEEILEEAKELEEEPLSADATKTEQYLYKVRHATKPVKREAEKVARRTKKRVDELFSTKEVVLQQRDVTTKVLEGAAVSAFVTAAIMGVLFGNR